MTEQDFSEHDLDAAQAKPRPRGSLPYLPDHADPDVLRAWLTTAFRPEEGWRVEGFERTGRDARDPCYLGVANGRERRRYRFNRQSDLQMRPRMTIVSATDAKLNVPHLTGSEVEDVWTALCKLGTVATEHDERDETRKWVEQFLRAASPLTGFTLVPDGRHDALMAIRRNGEFTRADALAMLRPSQDSPMYLQRPTRFLDRQTSETWIRAGETASFIRWYLGVEPMSHATLRARLSEVGVAGRLFEDYRPPHPKLNLYRVADELVGGVEGDQ